MAKNVNFARRVTLDKIADAIKKHQAKQNHIINVKILAKEFALALRDGVVNTTAPSADRDLYKIERKTLVDVADVIRDITGTTEEILGADFEERILNLTQKLDAPVIEIVAVDVEGDGEAEPTIQKLETPKILVVTVEGADGGEIEPTLIKLDTPVIEIVRVDSEGDQEEPIPLTKLDTPIIGIVPIDVVDTEEPEIVITKLSAPIISIVPISSDGESGEEPELVQLAMPIIEIITVNVDAEEEPKPTITKLAKPNITITWATVEDGTETEPVLKPLDAPIIKIEEVIEQDKEEPEPTLQKLYTPSIVIDEVDVEDHQEPEYIISRLTQPEIIFGWNIEEGEQEPEYILTKLVAPTIEIADVDVVIEEEPEQIISRLTAPIIEIVSVDVEIEQEPEQTIQKLVTPNIEIVGKIISDVTPAIMGKAIMGRTIMGDYLGEGSIGVEKVDFDNDGYIDESGNVVTGINAQDKSHTNLIPISKLANGADGYCVRTFDRLTYYPKILFFSDTSKSSVVGVFYAYDIGYKEKLTASEIRSLAVNVDGARYVAFNSDFESGGRGSDYVYISRETKDEPTKLNRPEIQIMTIGGLMTMTYDNYGYMIRDGEIVESDTIKYSALIPLQSLANGYDGWCVFIEDTSNSADRKGAFYDDDGNYVGAFVYEDAEGTAEAIRYYAEDYPTATHVRFFLDTTVDIEEGQDVIYIKI